MGVDDYHRQRLLPPTLTVILTTAIIEHGFECPCCGEPITMVLDLSVSVQSYVEDCEVCCNPIALAYSALDDRVLTFEARELC